MKMDIKTLLPNQSDLEKSLLSSVIIDNEVIHEITLNPDDFYQKNNQIIFETMQKMQNNNIQIDAISLFTELKEKIKNIASVLHELSEIPFSPNVEYYCKKIREKAILRKLMMISHKTFSACQIASGDPTAILDNAQEEIYNINSQGTESYNFKENLQQSIEKIEKLSENNSNISGLPTGYKFFDRFTAGLQPSDLILLAARPSMGKTSFALNIFKNICVNDSACLFFSLEMSTQQLIIRLVSDLANVPGHHLKNGKLDNEQWEEISKAYSVLDEGNFHVVDEANISIQRIISIARQYKRNHNIKAIFIDYIQLVKGWNKDGQGPKAEISRGLKILAKSLNIPVIALSQLNRQLENRPNKRPINSDLRESGALEQDADIIAFIYRDEVYNPGENNEGEAEIIIRKNRNGACDTINLSFIGGYTRFENIGVYET